MSLEIQWLTLVVMFGAGAGMGVLFDSYRVVSDHFKWPRWSLSVLDMLYWIISAIFVFRLLYAANFGDVRGYVFIGLAFGAIIYAFMLSKVYSALVIKIIYLVQRMIHAIIRIFDFVIVKPLKFLYKIVIVCIKIGTKFTIRLIEIMLQLLLPILKLLLWPLKPLYKPIFSYVSKYWSKHISPHVQKTKWLNRSIENINKWAVAIKTWIYS